MPLVYVYLVNKKGDTYSEMWRYLVELTWNQAGELLFAGNKKILMDFEIAAHQAVKQIFPHFDIGGCRFHFGQSLWRHLQALGVYFTDAYKATKNEQGILKTILCHKS